MTGQRPDCLLEQPGLPVTLYLAIDAGNSRLKFGLLELRAGELPVCRQSISIAHDDPLPAAEIDGWLAPGKSPERVTLLAGVAPAAMERVVSQWSLARWPAPRIISRARELPLAVRTDAPDRVGIDRLLNGVAVNRLRGTGQPAIVIDSGTATTVDLIAADGAFEGGAILPGVDLCARSLHQYTALLPLVPATELTGEIESLGRNTRGAIAAGLLYGQVGAIRELAARYAQSVREAPLIVVTGGNGPLLAPHLGPSIRVEHDLPLKGLVISVAGRAGTAVPTDATAP